MTDDEFPLLRYPALMVVVLKEGQEGPADLEACVQHVQENLRQAHITASLNQQDLVERLHRARFHLEKAGLVEPCVGETYRTTQRGKETLCEHPKGVDDSVLMEFPEFRAFVHATSGNRSQFPEGAGEYDQGYEAYLAGRAHTANPYDFDTRAHLSWENGWFEAADEHEATPKE